MTVKRIANSIRQRHVDSNTPRSVFYGRWVAMILFGLCLLFVFASAALHGASTANELPNIQSAFAQPKPIGSIFPSKGKTP